MRRLLRGVLPPAFGLALALACCSVAAAQDGGDATRREAARADINYEVQLNLLITAEADQGAARVPQGLDAVVRQLKSTLPAADYRLAATFINRVRDGGRFDVKTVGGYPFTTPQPNTMTPAFFQFVLTGVKMGDEQSGLINVQEFRLGLKVPIQTSAVGGDKAGQSFPVIQYEDTGINTQMSVREGEPTLVGTLNTSRPGQLFALVITIRRAGR